jgi:GT2 family glycosyltransferase
MPRGLNYGIEQSRGEFIFVLNDDVILTRHSLQNLVNMLDQSDKIGLIMPTGNDQQQRYHLALPCQRPPAGYRLEDLNPDLIDQLMSAASFYPPGIMFSDTLCIYAFLMRRSVFDEIGGFDENLISGDDIDYCLRLRHRGYINAIALDSLVWHAGGASADLTMTPEKRELGQKIFNEKWGGP